MNLSKMLVSIKIPPPIYTADEGVICRLNAMLLVSPSPPYMPVHRGEWKVWIW